MDRLSLGIIAFVGALLAVQLAFAEPKNFLLCTEDEEQFPLYIGHAEEFPERRPGVAVEMIRSAAAKVNTPLKITRMPWKRCVEALRVNDVDGIFNASFSPEREEFASFPKRNGKLDPERRLLAQTYHFYRKAHDPVIFADGQLKNLRAKVGVPLGFSITQDLAAKQIPYEEVKISTLNMLTALGEGRFGALAIQNTSADSVLARDRVLSEQVERLDPPIIKKDYYVALGTKFYQTHKDWAEKFWDQIGAVRKQQLARLMASYN